jgi:hypothetical protein
MAGKSSESGSSTADACTNCAAGSYSGGSGASCTLCPAGTYNTREGSEIEVDCEDCASGTYNPAEGSASPADCQDCAAGTASSDPGATSPSSCGTCYAGSFAPAGSSTCTSCVAGRYSSEVGLERLDDCLTCAAGKASPLMGATNENACSACTPGSYSTGGNAECLLCAAGKYNTAPSSTQEDECEPCSAGKSSSVQGAYDVASCTSCLAGSYTYPGGGSASCTPCPVGKYGEIEEASYEGACKTCPSGLTSNGGSSSTSQCYPEESIFYNLYMTDPKERIFTYNAASKTNQMAPVFEGEPLTSPTSFLFTSPTTFLVADKDSNKVLKFEYDGTYLEEYAPDHDHPLPSSMKELESLEGEQLLAMCTSAEISLFTTGDNSVGKIDASAVDLIAWGAGEVLFVEEETGDIYKQCFSLGEAGGGCDVMHVLSAGEVAPSKLARYAKGAEDAKLYSAN